MPIRKPTYLVQTAKARLRSGKVLDEDPWISSSPHRTKKTIIKKTNPRIKTKHPHATERYSDMINGSDGKITANKWLFTTEASARRSLDKKRKKFLKKHNLTDSLFLDRWY